MVIRPNILEKWVILDWSDEVGLAYMWFNLAASNGQKNARDARDLILKTMTYSQIEKGQEMTRKWHPL